MVLNGPQYVVQGLLFPYKALCHHFWTQGITKVGSGFCFCAPEKARYSATLVSFLQAGPALWDDLFTPGPSQQTRQLI